MEAFNLGKIPLPNFAEIFAWIHANISPEKYKSPERPPERYSYYFEVGGDGWRCKYITTLNKQDQYPDEFAMIEHMNLGGSTERIYHYSILEIDNDADVVMFKLKWL